MGEKNRQKVNSFRPDAKRKCSITVSPNDTVGISILCSIKPHEPHTPSNLLTFSFIGSNTSLFAGKCAQQRGIASHIVILNWFDYNKDLVVEELRDINIAVNGLFD